MVSIKHIDKEENKRRTNIDGCNVTPYLALSKALGVTFDVIVNQALKQVSNESLVFTNIKVGIAIEIEPGKSVSSLDSEQLEKIKEAVLRASNIKKSDKPVSIKPKSNAQENNNKEAEEVVVYNEDDLVDNPDLGEDLYAEIELDNFEDFDEKE